MHKKLMAVAVAGVFAAPALALAQSSTVQIYGRLTYEYGYADQGSGRPNADVAQAPVGSAIGFRGEEKLGGGLTAWFQCESSADVRGGLSGNQNGFCTRNSAVGLKGAWGNLHFGRWDSPFKRATAVGAVGVHTTGLLGHADVWLGGSGGTNAISASNRNRWRRRDAAVTYYESPIFKGFQILGGFTPGNAATAATSATTSSKPRVWSVSGLYKNGPFAVGLGYEEHRQFGAVGGENDDDAWTINAAYTFMNKIKVGVSYIDATYETSTTTETEKKNWQVGVDWKIAGPHGLEAAYTQAGDSKGNGTITIGDVAPAGPDTGAGLYSIKYRYSFSKRTKVKIGYIKLDNDRNAFYALGGLRRPVANGADQDAIALYMEHFF